MIGNCFSRARHDGALSLGRKAAGGGPAGPTAGCQGSRLASSWVGGEYSAIRRGCQGERRTPGGGRADHSDLARRRRDFAGPGRNGLPDHAARPVRVGAQLARVGKGTDAPAPRDRNGAGGPRGGSPSSGQGGRNEYGVPGIPVYTAAWAPGTGWPRLVDNSGYPVYPRSAAAGALSTADMLLVMTSALNGNLVGASWSPSSAGWSPWS